MYLVALILVITLIFGFCLIVCSKKLVVQPNLKIASNKNSIPNQIYFVIIFALVLFVGLRAKTVGLDSHSYAEDIGNSVAELEYSNYEYGYIALIRLLTVLKLNYSVLFVVAAFVAITPVFLMIRDESDYPVLSVIIYFGTTLFIWSFSALRQSMALGLIACAYYFIKNKKRLLFLLFVFLAFCFHKTALFFTPAILFSFFKINKKCIFVTIVIGVVLIVSQSFILNFLSSYSRIDSYFDVEMEGGERYLAVLFFVALLFVIQYRNIKTDPFLFFSIVLLPFIFFVVNKNSVLNRASWYYQLLLIVAIPKVIKSFNTKSFRVCLYILMAFLFSYQFISSIINDVAGIADYQLSFWGSIQ